MFPFNLRKLEVSSRMKLAQNLNKTTFSLHNSIFKTVKLGRRKTSYS